MKVVGFITEYNPFHLGHKYHLSKSRELTEATHTVAVMSSSFVQRGEPALIDKWTRAQMAIDNGVDLVIELPFLYSVESAEFFAFGAVSILNSLNVVDYIAFGSELGVIEPLIKVASILNEEPLYFKEILKKCLDSGMSYSASRSFALDEYLKKTDKNDTIPYKEILKQSNNILGIEYLKALQRLHSPIKPIALTRMGSNYNDIDITTSIPSATGIRNILYNQNLDSIENMIPEESSKYIKNFYSKYGMFNYLDNYSYIFEYLFRTLNPIDLKKIIDMENGLENRILKSSMESNKIEYTIDKIMTKRYPKTRIKRILIHMLANLDKDTIRKAYSKPINYIRVLGSTQKGLELLKKIKSNSDVSIITKFADYKSYKDDHMAFMLGYEEKATDLYYLGLKRDKPIVNMDYLMSPYIK